MSGEDTLIIINPHAGLLNPGAAGPGEVEFLARKILPRAEVLKTKSEEHAREAVANALARGFRIVASAGGDGTAHFLAGLLAGTDTALGIIPLGSAGNVARALEIPSSTRRAMKTIRRGRRSSIDLGYVNEKHFIEAAGIGLHANVLKKYALKENKSLIRGVYALADTLSQLEPFTAELELDDKIRSCRAVQITVSNLPLYGTGFNIAPEANARDGLLDVTIIEERAADWLLMLPIAARLGRMQRFPGISRFQAKSVGIKTVKPMPVHADAEMAGETPAVFRAESKSVTIITP